MPRPSIKKRLREHRLHARRMQEKMRYAFTFRLRESKPISFRSLYASEDGTFIAVTEGIDFADCYAKATSRAESRLKDFDNYTLHSVMST